MRRAIIRGGCTSALLALTACCPDPAPRGDCAGVVARITGSDWTAGPGVSWAVDGTEAVTVVCEALPAANGDREPCETTFAVDEAEPRSEVLRAGGDYVAYLYLGLNEWPELPERATLTLEWTGGGADEHEIVLADEEAVESGNQCPQRCRTGEHDAEGVEGGG